MIFGIVSIPWVKKIHNGITWRGSLWLYGPFYIWWWGSMSVKYRVLWDIDLKYVLIVLTHSWYADTRHMLLSSEQLLYPYNYHLYTSYLAKWSWTTLSFIYCYFWAETWIQGAEQDRQTSQASRSPIHIPGQLEESRRERRKSKGHSSQESGKESPGNGGVWLNLGRTYCMEWLSSILRNY